MSVREFLIGPSGGILSGLVLKFLGKSANLCKGRLFAHKPPQLESIYDLCGEYGTRLVDSHALASLDRQERRAIREATRTIPFDLDANAFLRLVIAELSFCHRFGQKRSHQACEEGCHFTGYLCHAVQNCISNRFPISVRNFCQGLAWLLGDEKVEIEHLLTVVPFALAHRIQWKEEFLATKTFKKILL